MPLRWQLAALALCLIADYTVAGGLLPKPSGKFAVGVVSCDWVDAQRADPFPQADAQKRRLAVRIWYPATRGSGKLTQYLRDPDYWVPVHGDRVRVINDNVEVHARSNAPAAPGSGTFPVIVFSPGANQPRSFYQSWFEEWASHGVVVVAVAHPHANRDSFEDGAHMTAHPKWSPPAMLRTVERDRELYAFWGPMIDCLSADQRFVIDQLQRMNKGKIESPLAARLNADKVIVAGHSRGAKAAYRTARLDSRVIGCIVMDDPPPPPEREGLPVPVLAMMPKQASPANRTHTSTLFANARSLVIWAEIDRTSHMSFTDLPLIAPEEWDLSPEEAKEINERIRHLTTDFLYYCITRRPHGLVGTGQSLPGVELRTANLPGD